MKILKQLTIFLNWIFVLVSSDPFTIFLEQDYQPIFYATLQLGIQGQQQTAKFMFNQESTQSYIVSTQCPDTQCINTNKFSCLESQGCEQTFISQSFIDSTNYVMMQSQIVNIPSQFNNAIINENDIAQTSNLNLDLVTSTNSTESFYYYNAFGLKYSNRSSTNIMLSWGKYSYYITLVKNDIYQYRNVQSQIGLDYLNASISSPFNQFAYTEINHSGQYSNFSASTSVGKSGISKNTLVLDMNYKYIDLLPYQFDSLVSELKSTPNTIAVVDGIIYINNYQISYNQFEFKMYFDNNNSQPLVVPMSNAITQVNRTTVTVDFKNAATSYQRIGQPFFYQYTIGFNEDRVEFYSRDVPVSSLIISFNFIMIMNFLALILFSY